MKDCIFTVRLKQKSILVISIMLLCVDRLMRCDYLGNYEIDLD